MHRVELEPVLHPDYFYSGKKKKDCSISKYVYDKTLGMDVINYTWVDRKTHLEIMYDKRDIPTRLL